MRMEKTKRYISEHPEIIVKYLRGEWRSLSPEQVEELRVYMTENPDEAMSLRQEYNLGSLLLLETQPDDNEVGLRNLKSFRRCQRKKHWAGIFSATIKVAAVLVLAILLGHLYGDFRIKHTLKDLRVEVQAPEGQRLRYRLSDGTVAYLSPRSKLILSGDYGRSKQRKVELDGSAYFEVESDMDHPFLISTPAGYDVKVTGTEFFLQSDSLMPFSLSLEKGAVSVYKDGASGLLVDELKPGEELTLTQSGFIKEDRDVEEISLLQRGVISYSSAPLKDVLQELSYWYKVSISFENNCKDTLYMTGKIKLGDPLPLIIQAISSSFSISVEWNPDGSVRIRDCSK